MIFTRLGDCAHERTPYLLFSVRRIFQILAFGTSLALGRVPVPERSDPDFSQLVSADFLERENAYLSFTPWIAQDQKYAQKVLLQRYAATDDPELRVRLFKLLERAYFPIHGFLGIRMRHWYPKRDTDGEFIDGVQIQDIVEGSQAETEGLQVGDRLIEIEGWQAKASVNLDDKFIKQIQSYPPGSLIKLRLVRQNKELEMDFRLGVRPTPGEDLENRDGPVNRHLHFHDRPLLRVKEFQMWLRMELEKLEKRKQS